MSVLGGSRSNSVAFFVHTYIVQHSLSPPVLAEVIMMTPHLHTYPANYLYLGRYDTGYSRFGLGLGLSWSQSLAFSLPSVEPNVNLRCAISTDWVCKYSKKAH